MGRRRPRPDDFKRLILIRFLPGSTCAQEDASQKITTDILGGTQCEQTLQSCLSFWGSDTRDSRISQGWRGVTADTVSDRLNSGWRQLGCQA
jgi:hypothetical protein